MGKWRLVVLVGIGLPKRFKIKQLHGSPVMTPAAVASNTSPRARSQGVVHILDVVSDMKRSSTVKTENKEMQHASFRDIESCEEEDVHSLSRKHRHIPSGTAACISIGRYDGNHVEISDEDVGTSRSGYEIKKGRSYMCAKNKLNEGNELFSKEECVDSIIDDHHSFLNGSNRGNYYIIRSGGRFAEMFRTDIFDRLRKGYGANDDSDDEDVPGDGLARMPDRWRAEWSNGIQIPTHSVNPHPSDVRKTIVKRLSSRANNSAQKKRSAMVASFARRPYSSVQCSPLRLYESTTLDERWLELFNEHCFRKSHCKPLPMDVFLEVMNEFEVECYKNIHQKLLEPLRSPSSRLGDADEEAACDICRAVDSDPDDEMVFCDGCNLCVHMSCYGLSKLPANEWLCMKCRLSYGRNPPCVLCPTIGGALKCTDRGDEWAHVVCALWIPECRFGDFEKREPITRIDEIIEERWVAKCSICDTRQGACIKCSMNSCSTSFHASCALRSGLEMRIEQDSIDDKVHMISLCSKHRFADPLTSNQGLCEFSQTASDDETEGNCGSAALTELERTCYKFVESAAIAAKLHVDENIVNEVFAYWVQKRLLLNNGKPLIDNLQDEIKIVVPETPQLELPTYAECGPSTVAKMKRKRGRPRKCPLDQRTFVDAVSVVSHGGIPSETQNVNAVYAKLSHSLSRGRLLLHLVVRKCLEQKKYVDAHKGVLALIGEYASRPIPISGRTTSFLRKTLESCCSKEAVEEEKRRASKSCNIIESTAKTESTKSNVFEARLTDETSSFSAPAALLGPPLQEQIDTNTYSKMNNTPRKSLGKSASAAPRFFMSFPRHGKNDFLKTYSRADEIEEQRERRRKSLRSFDAKSSDPAEGRSQSVMNTEILSSGRQLNQKIGAASRNTAADVNMSGTEEAVKVDTRSDCSPSLRPSLQPVGSSDRKRYWMRQKGGSDELRTPLTKRQKSECSSGSSMRLLKSLNLSNANKDFKHRWATS